MRGNRQTIKNEYSSRTLRSSRHFSHKKLKAQKKIKIKLITEHTNSIP